MGWWKSIHLAGPQRLLLTVFGILLLVISLGCAMIPSPLVAIALLAVPGVSVISILHPRLALLLLVACAGLPAFVLPLPGHNMHLVEPVSLLCLCIVLIRHPPGYLRLIHLLAFVFLAIAVISFIHVPQFSSASNGYSSDKQLLALCIVFSVFFSSTFLAQYIGNISSFLTTVLLVSLPLYLVGLAQVVGLHLAAQLEAPGAYDLKLSQGRLWGPFPWSVNFGMYLVNLFAVALVCWHLGTHRYDRLIGCVMTLATALEIIGCGTRSVAIAAGVILIVSFVVTKHVKLLFSMVALSTGMCVPFLAQLLPLFSHDETSTGNRLFIWHEALVLIATHPWLGIGLQQFPRYYAQLIVSRATQLGPEGIHPHQQYLEWAMESGILWCIVGILLLVSIMFTCWQNYHSAQREQQMLLLAASLAILANSIIGFFDAPLDQLEGPIFLLMLAGLASGCIEHPGSRSSQTRRSLRLPITRAAPLTALENDIRVVLPERAGLTSAKVPDTRKTGRSIVLQLLSWAIPLPLIFPMTALLAHYLGPIQYGEYSLTFPFLTIFALLSGSGMDVLLIRQLSCQARSAWSTTLSYATGTRLLSTLLSTILAAIVALVLPMSNEERSLFLLGSASLLFSFSFNGLRIIYAHGFRAEQQIGILSLLETVNRVFTALLVALAVFLHLSLLWAYVLLVYSDLPAFLLLAYIASKRFGIRMRFNLQRFREHMSGGFPLVGQHVLTLLCGQFDLFVLMLVTGPLNVGIYALASRIIDPLNAIAVAYVNGLYPLLCAKFAVGQRQFAQTYYAAVRILGLVVIPLAVCVCVAADNIVHILGGQHFAAASTAVQLLMWAMVATFFNQLGQQACTAANMERRVPRVAMVSVSINILANLLLIPRWQIIGAGVAALLSECAGLCVLFLLLRPYIRLPATIGVLLLLLIDNLPALIFLLWQHTASLLLTIPIALLLTMFCYVITHMLTVKDVTMISHVLFSRQQRRSVTNDYDMHSVELASQRRMADDPTLILPRVQV